LNCSNITCEHSSPTPLANTLSRQSTQLFRRVNSSNHGHSVYYSVIGLWFKPQADMSLFHLSVSVEYVAASRPRHGPYIYRSCLSMISVDVKHHQCLLLLRYLAQRNGGGLHIGLAALAGHRVWKQSRRARLWCCRYGYSPPPFALIMSFRVALCGSAGCYTTSPAREH